MESDIQKQRFILSVTVDFPDDVRYGIYNLDRIDEMMSRLKGMGVSRVYWLYYGDNESSSYWATNYFSATQMKYGQEAIDNLGEPLRAAVPIAHKYGIEIYGVLKPYNTGVSRSIPEGSPDSKGKVLSKIGGFIEDAIPFTVSYPYTRMKRRSVPANLDLDKVSVCRIKLTKSDKSPTRIKHENLEIWVSSDNYQYERIQVRFDVRETVEVSSSEVVDYYGNVVTPKGAPVRSLILDGLELDDKYILVTTNFEDGTPDFINTAINMIQVYGPEGDALPIVVANRSGMGHSNRDFRGDGLDFDNGFGLQQTFLDVNNSNGPTSRDDGDWWRETANGGVIGFALGKNEFLPATPCEVYPEVRKLWDGWVERIIDAGVDGIDVRVSHHGSLVNEPYEYGFNDPVVHEFVLRHGHSPTNSVEDMKLLASLRGEHFTEFLKVTSHKVRLAGAKMQCHVHTEAFRTDVCHGQLMGFPANINFAWKDWISGGFVDGVTLRTSWFEALESPSEEQAYRARLERLFDDQVVKDVLGLASDSGIPVYLNRYISRAIGIDEYLNDIESVYYDDRFAGFDVYEFAGLARPVPDGTKLEEYKGRIERITEKAEELGLV